MQEHLAQSSPLLPNFSRQAICSGCSVSLHCALQPVVPSQSSPGSRILLPHTDLQSLSVFAVAPLGQQPSPALASVMRTFVHSALQLSALPMSLSTVQGSLSSHSASLVLHGLSVPGSQVSPSSSCTILSPHEDEQSESFLSVQFPGQQPSPLLQSSCKSTHSA